MQLELPWVGFLYRAHSACHAEWGTKHGEMTLRRLSCRASKFENSYRNSWQNLGSLRVTRVSCIASLPSSTEWHIVFPVNVQVALFENISTLAKWAKFDLCFHMFSCLGRRRCEATCHDHECHECQKKIEEQKKIKRDKQKSRKNAGVKLCESFDRWKMF